MTVLIVDKFKAIKIQKSNPKLALAPLRRSHRLTQPIGEQHSVGQTRECVIVGDLFQVVPELTAAVEKIKKS